MMKMREIYDRSRAGFTAIALLLVIVILAAGVAYFWPFYTACGGARSKVSRVKSDLRSIATALESYYIDNNTYPAWSAERSRS